MDNFNPKNCSLPEFVGMTVLDTIGLTIPGVDYALRREMSLPDRISALGILSSRTGAAGQICAVDDALKNSNTEIISIEFPRDTKGWGGHGNYIVIGGKDAGDVRNAVETSLRLIKRNAGEVYINSAGHLEFAYSASASEALNKAFGTPPGKAFGFAAGSPAAIGLVMANYALKSASISVTKYMTPSRGTSHSNEVIIAFCGDAEAVKTAVLRSREIGLDLLISMGDRPSGPSLPYL